MNFLRLFTQTTCDAYDLIHFRQPVAMGNSFDVPLEHPDNWDITAVEVLADEAATCCLPAPAAMMEENTVPSWLWRQARAKAVGGKESSVRDIFDRVVGAAAYQGWKHNLFANEESARAFYDEARYALAQRFIALEPQKMAAMGLNWAYGISLPTQHYALQTAPAIDISNSMIDSVVSGKRDRATLTAWNKIIGARSKATTQTLRFADTEAQWETPATTNAAACLNLMAFRHNDGTVNIDALRQATRILVVLLDMQEIPAGHELAIGFTNLAPLLMALALPYDSEAARATAAAITAIITAEAYAASAELAALRGASPAFANNRDASLRALRNHHRAAYGEHNDYEKISVTPAPLALASCPDLALTAAARTGWDYALDRAQANGLRHTQVTSLLSLPALTRFMESESEGIAPMRAITVADNIVHPSAHEALVRLGYDQKKIADITRHVAGALTLEKAPAINHASLRAKGLTAAAIKNLEDYLPQAKSLRFAATVWVIGVDFCRNVLKVPAAKIDDMRFNLLAHLGYSASDIASAQAWCYGYGGFEGVAFEAPQHAAIFATMENLSAEAQIRMAASVQGFVSGETDLKLTLPVGTAAERFEKLLLDAWRRGVKSTVVTFDPNMRAESLPRQALRRKTARSAFLHAKAPVLPKRQARLASAPRLGSMSHAKAKSRSASKGH